MEYLLSIHEDVYLSALLTVLAISLLWEMWAPRRRYTMDLTKRWPTNFALVLINIPVLHLALPVSAVAVALAAERGGLGLFNQIAMPPPLVLVLSILLMDLGN